MLNRTTTTETKQNPDEVIPFKNNSNTNNISLGITKPKNKYGANSGYGIAMIILGTAMYSLIGTITLLSKQGSNRLPYNSNASLVMVECGKFIITVILLLYLQGFYGMIKSLTSVPFGQWFWFSVPAILYSITNNVGFYSLRYMDPGSMGVLQQTKIITTALLWWYWFKKTIDKQQWFAIILLLLGSMLVAWPDNNNENKQQMYVIWPMGPILIFIIVILSAIAGIYTEFVYKRFGRNRSIHIDNLSMYFWGSIANILQFYYVEYNKNNSFNELNLFHGFNMYTYLVIIDYIILGLTIAYVMKYFTNIIKLFMSGSATIVSGILTYFIFELKWTFLYSIGLISVVFALILYKSPVKYIK